MDHFFKNNTKIARSKFLCGGLVGAWDLSKGKSKFIYDKSGFGNTLELKNGNINNQCNWGLHGPSLELDGINYLESTATSANSSLQLADSLTVSTWINVVSDGTIISCSDLLNYQGWKVFLNSGQVYFSTGTGSIVNTFGSGFSINYNEWILITVVQNRLQSKVSFYLNGFEQVQNSTTAHNATAPANKPLIVGEGTTGEIESLFVWNRALTPSEVGHLFVEPYQSFTYLDYGDIVGLINPTDIFQETGTGSIIAGGSASVETIQTTVTHNITASGGSLGGGTATATVRYNVTATGGSLGGGTATTTTVRYNVTGTGGSLAGGTALQTFSDITETSGGSLGGGTATATIRYNVTATGGSVAGGTALQVSSGVTETSGGSLSSGTATPTVSYNITPTGGSLGGGTVTPTVRYNTTASGGSLVSGTVTPTVRCNITPTGGLLVSGNALQIFTDIVEASGGVVCSGGTFKPNIVYDIVPDLGDNYANYGQTANWNGTDQLPYLSQGNITTVGTNGRSSYYGTYDQCGNVREWVDIVFDGVNYLSPLRGGRMNMLTEAELSSDYRDLSHAPDGSRVDGDVGQGAGGRISTINNPLNLPNFVTVGDAGNNPDDTGFGSVSYVYKIAKYEITYDEYCEFLNAVAKTDTYTLFQAGTGPRVGMTRSGSSGSYVYTVDADFGNKPFNLKVDWFKLARYCNWLHNGKPIGSQNSSTTEGGAYTLNGANGPTDWILVNSGAAYRIPTEDEWYKAAYYKGGGTIAGYWSFATQSETIPNTLTASSTGDGILPNVMGASGIALSYSIYNTTTTGGSLGGGTATPATRYNITATGGSLGGGTVTPTVRYNITATGGSSGGGTATATVRYNIAVSGGSLGGGTATATVRYNIAVSGGSLGGGTATATVSYNIAVSGGSLGGGTALVTAVYNINASGGVICSGPSEVQSSFLLDENGNLIVSESGDFILIEPATLTSGGTNVNAIYNITVSGGSLGGGTATATVRYNVTATGGSLGGGTATATVRYNVTATGGSLGGGTALQTFTDIAETSGGSLSGGTAAAIVLYSVTASGGLLGNGTVSQTSSDVAEVFGGSLGSGTATATVRYNVTVTGGSLGGGTATVRAIYNFVVPYFDGEWTDKGYTVNNVVHYNGLYYICIRSFAFENNAVSPEEDILDFGGTKWAIYSATNNALLSGSAKSTAIYAIAATGGSLGGGTAVQVFSDAIEASGGSLGGGAVTSTIQYNITTTGGLLGGSTATLTAIYGIAVTGGLLGGSTATLLAIYGITATGGSLGSGTALQIFTDIVETTGGSLSGGTVSPTTIYNTTSSGGSLGGGAALQAVNDIIEVSGGLLSGGAVSPNVTCRITTTGGTLASGSVNLTSIYNYNPTLNTSLLLYLKFDEPTGSTTVDSSIYNHTTSAYSNRTANVAPLKFTNSYAFENFDRIELTNFDLNKKYKGFSLSFWYSAIYGDTSTNLVFNSDPTYFLTLISGGYFFTDAYLSSNTQQSILSTSVPISSTWNHICYTWDSSTSLFKLYVNGAEAASISLTGDYIVGSPSYNSIADDFSGDSLLDDFRIYSRSLTINEISRLAGGYDLLNAPLAGSTATSTLTYNITATGGSLAGGTTLQTFSDVAEVAGGSLGGGAATSTFGYNVTATGGSLTGGTASQISSDVAETSGGSLGGGIIITTATYNIAATGGSLGGGTALQVFTDIAETSGGSLGGGTAAPTILYNITATGGSVAGGTALQISSDVAETSGGLLGSGVSTLLATYSITATGGLIGGGIATPTATYGITAISGSLGSGTATLAITYNIEVTGGSLSSGTATQASSDVAEASGGSSGGGDATPTVVYSITATGGSVIGGVSLQTFTDIVEVFGGSTIAGTATSTIGYNPTATGGVLNGGSSLEATISINQVSGGIIVSGTRVDSIYYGPVVTGGLSISTSTALEYCVYNISSTGGLKLNGGVSVSTKEDMNGGILVGGNATELAIFSRVHISSGRVRVTGKASYSYTQSQFKHVASGSIFTINSDSIFTLSYFDSPCPDDFDNAVAKFGFNCKRKQPNPYISCETEDEYYGQCVVLKGRSICPNKNARLSAITLCRQQGFLPPKKKLLGR